MCIKFTVHLQDHTKDLQRIKMPSQKLTEVLFNNSKLFETE